MAKKDAQTQFSGKAEAYATSQVHARGSSLGRLLALVPVQPDWAVLDVATGAGHTAHTFAPHVAQVVATDITADMLAKTGEIARTKGLENVALSSAAAETLPFVGRSFDLVTCRIAPHHFERIDRFVNEAARVLKPAGFLAVVDNIVPCTRSRKKRDQTGYQAAAEFLNAFESLRDPSHRRMLSLLEWQTLFVGAGLTIAHTETMRKAIDFTPWAARMEVSPGDTIRLRVMLAQTPKIVKEFLTPEFADDRIVFHLTEGIMIGQKPAPQN